MLAAKTPGSPILVQYIAVRLDLHNTFNWPWGAVIAQACHASVGAIIEHLEQDDVKQYVTDIDSMRKVIVEVLDQSSLLLLSEKLTEKQIKHKLWTEQPEGIITCLATAVSAQFCKLKTTFFRCTLSSVRYIAGVKTIRQKQRNAYHIIRPKQTHYIPKPTDYSPLPKSIMHSGPLKSLLRSKSQKAIDIVSRLDLVPYACSERGVRSRYFGFEGAKRAAIAFRRRLIAEWNELEAQWKKIDEQEYRFETDTIE